MLLYISIGFVALCTLTHLTLLVLNLTGVIDKRWRNPLLYVALGVVGFVYFVFLGFPFDRLLATRQVADGIERFQRENGVKLEVGSIKGGWLFDVVARDIKITAANPMRRATPDAAPDEPMLAVESVHVRLAPLTLLTGKLGVHLDAALYGGHVAGTIGLGSKATTVDLSVRNIELAKYTPLTSKWQVNVTGQAGGTVDLFLDKDDGAKSTGKIDLALKNAMIAESSPFGIKIPQARFDKGAGAVVELREGKAALSDVGLHGDELDVGLEGEIELRKILAYSNWNARSSIKLSEAFKSQVPLLDAVLGAGKGSDGAYHYRLTGSVNRMPNAVPDRGSSR